MVSLGIRSATFLVSYIIQ